ncbi:MAG: DUF296 domain-containing protein [Candidatus Diapherotrites archaeon]
METKKSGNTVLVRLDKGDELISSLERACEENGVEGGMVFGLGALSSMKIITAASTNKLAPEFEEIKGPIEIASATGNVSKKEGKVFVHLHASLGLMRDVDSGNSESQSYNTHISEGIISLTGEFYIIPTEKLERKLNKDTNMFIWDLK